MIYKCTLSKQVFRSKARRELGCEAYYELELPFVPFEGLSISVESIREKIREITYNVSTQEFLLYTTDALPVEVDDFPENANDMIDYNGLKLSLKMRGWQLSEENEPGFYLE